MLKKMNVVKLFIIMLSIFVFIIGLSYGYLNKESVPVLTDNLNKLSFININNLLVETGVLSISVILSPLGIGIITLIFYFSYQIFVSGFITFLFIKDIGILGIILSLIYFILFKLTIIVLLYALLRKVLFIFLYIIKSVALKQKMSFIILSNYMKKIIFILIIFFLYNTLLIVFGDLIDKLLSYFI